MAALIVWTMLAGMPQDEPVAPSKAEAAQTAKLVGPLDPATKEKRETARRQLAMLWALLALMSIVFVALGGIWLIIRQGRRLRRLPKAKKTKYYDMTVPDEKPPEATEPTATPEKPEDGAR